MVDKVEPVAKATRQAVMTLTFCTGGKGSAALARDATH